MSNNTLARLSVELAANTAAFQTDMGKAARVAEKELGSISAAAGKMGLALGAAVAASAAAMAILVKENIDAADELGKTSAKLGLTTEKLSAYNYIAKLSGSDTESFSGAIKKLNVNMVDAAKGQGAAKEAFTQLGIELLDQQGKLKDTDTIIREVSGRMSEMDDGAVKTALAVNIFGKAGADLIPMLNEGAKGFDVLTKEAQKMGLIVSGDAAAAAAEFNDNLDRLRLTTTGLGNDIMRSALPALNGLAKAMLDENSAARDAVRLITAAAAAYATATIAINAKAIALRAAAAAQAMFNVATKANPYVLAATGLAALVTVIYNYNKVMPAAVKVTEEASTAMSRFDAITRRAKEAIEEQNRAASGMVLPQIKDKIAGVSNEIRMLETLHKRASADFARGAVSSGLVASYDAQLKQKKQQLEYLSALVGEKSKSAVAVAASAQVKNIKPPKGQKGTADSGVEDDIKKYANEAGAANAIFDRDKARVQSALQSIQQGLMTKRQLEIQDFEQKKVIIEQTDQYLLMNKQQQLDTIEALEREHKGKLKALDDAELQQKQDQRLKMIGMVNNGLATIAGSQSKYAKIAQAAQKVQTLWQIGTDTRAMMVGAYKAMVGIPVIGPALAVAAAGAAFAFGAVQASAVGGSVGGSSSVGSAGSVASTGSMASAEPTAKAADPITTGTTIFSLPENAIMTARQIADMLDQVYASGKQPQNLRAILT